MGGLANIFEYVYYWRSITPIQLVDLHDTQHQSSTTLIKRVDYEENCMQKVRDHSLEQATAAGTVNQYMLSLLMAPHFMGGDRVVVPKERLRHYIRSARNQLRGRVGVVLYHAGDRQYVVRFDEFEGKPGFEKTIPLMHLQMDEKYVN